MALGLHPVGLPAGPRTPAAIALLTATCGRYRVKHRAWPGLATGHAARKPCPDPAPGCAGAVVACAGTAAARAPTVTIAAVRASGVRRDRKIRAGIMNMRWIMACSRSSSGGCLVGTEDCLGD